MAKSKPWEPNWIRDDKELDKGKQGRTFLARRSADPPDQFNFVMKLLLRQPDPVSRARMFREVACLQSLAHPAVATCVGSNASEFKTDVDLYMVMDRIVGPNLYEFVKNGPCDLSVALRITRRLLEALDHCHSAGVIHRDITPGH